MFPRRAISRRAIGAFLPLLLIATLLSGDSVLGQNGPIESSVTLVESTILPTTHVAVLGDGFLAAPTIAPLRSDRCAMSMNGPVERAARESLDTLVLVQNESCVGASLLSIGQEQVREVRSDTDLVVIGGIGLEFDWPSLALNCLQPETRSAPSCQEEAGIARATAANSFFSWRSLLQQIHRTAPDATIALVAPPLPVSDDPVALGSRCCNPTSDGAAQVRSVFDTSRALREAVVESMGELPIVVVSTTGAFDGHRMDDERSWLSNGASNPGTPTEAGAEAIADLIAVLMPVGTPITAPPSSPAEIVLVVGTTTDDAASHDALRDGAGFWIDTYQLADVNPSVALVLVASSNAPPPTTTTTTTTTTEAPTPPVAEASAPIEIVEQLPEVEAPEVEAPEVPAETEAPETEAPEVEAPVLVTRPAIELQELVSTYATSGDELAAALDLITTSNGVTSVSDLITSLSAGTQLFTPTVTDRRVIVRTANLLEEHATESDLIGLRETLNAIDAEITFLANSAEQALAWERMTSDTGVTVDWATTAELAGSLPAPEPSPQVLSVSAPDVDAVLGQPVQLAVDIEVVRPTTATIAWTLDGTIIASGQRTTINPDDLGVGDHEFVVAVETTREQLNTSFVLRVTGDGDGVDGDSCNAFDPFGTDLDNDGIAAECDTDDDGDNIPDSLDPCPNTPTSTLIDTDLDGRPNHCDADNLDGPRGDSDGDGFPDLIDNCPSISQVDLYDANDNGIGNACEGNRIVACTITGTAGDDVLRGTAGNDIICGLGGDDRIVGLGGDDIIFGGNGNDVLIGSGGSDQIYGGSGDDEISGNGDADTLLGESGNDILSGGFGSDVLSGGRGADSLTGDAGDDVLFGGRGNDTIRGGDGPDTIDGQGGNDTVYGEDGADILSGGPGADTVGGGKANDLLIDVQILDFVRGGTGDDLIGAFPLRVT